MNTVLAIKKLYPELKIGKDFIVRNDGENEVIEWYSDTITQPSQEEIDAIVIPIQEQEREEKKQANIRKDISEAFIEFKGGKFKIRKKDIGLLAGNFLLCDKTQTDPITVQDSEYNSIDLTVQEFGHLARLIELKREEIANKY